MSKAMKCDRCLTFFDPYIVDDRFCTIRSVIWQNGPAYCIDKINDRDEELNLCPLCANAFRLFMKNDREEKKDEKKDRNPVFDYPPAGDVGDLFDRVFGGG